uniref:Parkin co-regulated protein n=1 Tax=Palpitomonas bilix TaxID=652834 RepID=A0A7S3FZI5_9EUKA|mmetsp:Transcript_16296/g.41309  ORF Transcript_16296/g.41309 Transcript_16296/m.41309 type:complete len:281 (+) Transcript_16296:200-1042(+)
MSAAGGIGKVNVYKAGRDINEMSAAEKARMEAEIAKTLGEVPNNGRKSMTMKKMPAPPAKVMGTVRPGSASAAKSNPVTPRDIAQVMAAKGVGLFSGSKSGGVHRPKPQARAPPPPKAGAFKERKFSGRDTLLKKFYLRGDLPVAVLHKPNQNQLKWKVEPKELDYHYYVPVFFDGLKEMSDPYALFATQGVIDLIDADPSKMLPVIPQVIIPLKEALNTRNQHIIVRALRVIQKLVKDCPGVGEALVPYYRQLLPIFNLLKQKNNNLGDQILYSQVGKP